MTIEKRTDVIKPRVSRENFTTLTVAEIAAEWRPYLLQEIENGAPYTNLRELSNNLNQIMEYLYENLETEDFEPLVDKLQEIFDIMWEDLDIPEDFEDEPPTLIDEGI